MDRAPEAVERLQSLLLEAMATREAPDHQYMRSGRDA